MTAKIPIEVTSITADAQRDLNKLRDSIDAMGETGKKAGLSLTDLKSGLDMAAKGVEMVGKAYEATIGKTVEYAEQVRDLGRISGASAGETSRLIQTADDLKVEYTTLEQAAKALAKDGIALTTEELAKASDEYLSFSDAGERAEYATKKFGRAGLELTKVLETGGDALREMADSQSENLILTEEQVKQARELEKANDALEDSMAGLNYQVSMKLIPSVTAFIDLWGELLSLDSKDWFYDGADAAANFINRVFNGKKDVKDFADEARYLEGKFDNMADAAKDAARATQEVANQFRDTGQFSDEFNSDLGRSSLAVQDVNKSMRSLIDDAMKPLTAEMIYQKAAVGLNDDAALELARSMGLIKEETYQALVKLRDIRAAADANKDGFINAAEAANGYTDAVKALAAGDYLIKIRADFSDLERALGMAAQLNQAGTAGIKGPSFSWTPPSGGNGKPAPSAPSGEENSGYMPYGGEPAAPAKAGSKTTIVNINGWNGDGQSLAREIERQNMIGELMK